MHLRHQKGVYVIFESVVFLPYPNMSEHVEREFPGVPISYMKFSNLVFTHASYVVQSHDQFFQLMAVRSKRSRFRGGFTFSVSSAAPA